MRPKNEKKHKKNTQKTRKPLQEVKKLFYNDTIIKVGRLFYGKEKEI